MRTTDPVKRETSNRQVRKAKANGPGPKQKARQEAYFRYRALGHSKTSAAELVGVSLGAVQQWRLRDDFKRRDDTMTRRVLIDYRPPRCPFSEANREKLFALDYDTEPVNPRHLRIAIDFVNRLKPGQAGLILMPPEHAKSTIGEDWLNCGIADDPETRAVVISKTQPEAIKRLLKVQVRMEDRDFYPEYIDTWGPFKPDGRGQRPWGATKMSVARKTPRQRDFSLQAIGIGGQIQGQRIDKVLIDDPEDDKNYTQYLEHARYIRQSVQTRLGKTGIMVMIGTRQDEVDLYKHLMDEDYFDDVLIMPAIFEEDFSYTLASGEVISFEAGESLWPERYEHDDYAGFERKSGDRIWAMTYQQEDTVSEGQTFTLEMFERCKDERYRFQMPMRGHIPIVGLDPSVSNYTGGFCGTLDPKTKLRYVVDVWNEKGLTGDGGDITEGLIQFMVGMVETYLAKFLVLEANSAFKLLRWSRNLRAQLSEMGCELVAVQSDARGVEGLAIAQTSALFTNSTIIIPGSGPVPRGVIEWRKQMLAWRDDGNKKRIRDLVKAFQFFEVGARRAEKKMRGPVKVDTSNMPPYLRRQRRTVRLG